MKVVEDGFAVQRRCICAEQRNKILRLEDLCAFVPCAFWDRQVLGEKGRDLFKAAHLEKGVDGGSDICQGLFRSFHYLAGLRIGLSVSLVENVLQVAFGDGQGRRLFRRPCDLFQRRQRGNDFLCCHPYPLLTLLNVLRIGLVDTACFVGAAGKVVEAVAGIPKQGYQLPQLRKIELHHMSVNRHLAEIRRHVGGAELHHLRFNRFPLLRRLRFTIAQRPGEKIGIKAGLELAKGLFRSRNGKELFRFFWIMAKGGTGFKSG